MLYFAAYGRLKAGAEARLAGGAPEVSPAIMPPALPLGTLLACAGVAAAGAAAATHPLDVVKTRLQGLGAVGPGGVQAGRGPGQAPPRLSAASVAVALWRTGGARAFWAGGGARVAQLASATAIQWATYEKAREALVGRGEG